MKSNNREYNINHEEEKIIITKKFSKEAGQLGTAAYKTMMQLRSELPGYKFETKTIKKKKNKKSYAKLTLDNMKEHIEEMDGKDSAVMKEFENLMARYKLHAGRYAKIKSWYLKQYADEYKDVNDNDETEDTETENA